MSNHQNNPQSGLKCLKCGVTLSIVNSGINLMIEDYTANKQLHVCNPKDIEAHKLIESVAIKDMVKDVKIKQSEIMKRRGIVNYKIMSIPMDAPSKLQVNNPQEVPQVKSVRPTSREYLKSKGLKNPPLDSGISGGGDAPRKYASDMMEEWSNLNGKFRDKALFVAQSRIAELGADLNSANKRIDHYRTEVSKIRCFTFDSNNNIGHPGQNIFEAIQQTIDELEKKNAVYMEALDKIASARKLDLEYIHQVMLITIAEQALKDNG